MNESNKIRFLLFASLMIFAAHGLDVIFSSANKNFKQKAEIRTYIDDGEKTYCGTSNPLTYRPKRDTSKVIVYIIDRSRIVEILRNAFRETRSQIAQELSESHHELVFLGIDNFDDDEYHLIGAFMLEKIQPYNKKDTHFIVETIGEGHFDRVFSCYVMNFGMYRENAHICGGTLRARLRDIPRGALRPILNNGKEIRLYGYHPPVPEAKWSVYVLNDSYYPEVNVTNPKYNFRIRFQTKKICLLIVGGKEYSAVFRYGRTALKERMPKTLDYMTTKNEGLFIMGLFNFDWTEINIVAQIILEHSVGWQPPHFNVYTCGYGMFNSYYINDYVADGRFILPQPKTNVTKVIEELMGKEVKKRVIYMYYSDDGTWKIAEIPIALYNGRYIAEGEFEGYIFPWVYPKIAFIVYDYAETNDPIDYPMVSQFVEELKPIGIYVAIIKAINFGLEDMHIIAQWLDYHRGTIDSDRYLAAEQIAVLGGGLFDTIFQSESTTYKTLFDTNKNELKTILNAFVNEGNGKRVFAANIDNCSNSSSDSKLNFWTYPMNTVNGHYDPDLMPDKKTFDTKGGRKIFFIVTSANHFHHIAKISSKNMKPIIWLRETLNMFHYPYSDWSVFLVGLDNFGQRDYHLFAELVREQTKDDRYLYEFVHIFNYGIGDATFQYKDAPPFHPDARFRVHSTITYFFGEKCQLPGGTSSH